MTLYLKWVGFFFWSLTISLKVEVLEEGATGQAIRVRNPATKKELRGKVQNEQSIIITI
jgi:flagella basal body P-ring formation protein FlgA